MPELPEVETMRRGILPIVGLTILSARRTPCEKKAITVHPRIGEFNRRVAGRKIRQVDRLGKRVVVVLDDQQRIVFEPRMTGLVLIDQPPNKGHLRFELCLRSKSFPHLWFWDRRGLGLVSLLRADEYTAQYESRLGNDALEAPLAYLIDQFGHLKTPIKVALLDQRRLAGVGNLYAAEILHLAKVHPATPCRKLKKIQWQAIHQAMLRILNAAIRFEGSTLSDGTYRNALNEPGQFQNQHLVYDRAGLRCHSCRKSEIVRIVQAQRATFFCPHCQNRGQARKLKSQR